MIEFFVYYFLNTLNMICLLVLVGLGIAIIFGLMDVMNLAHGEFMTIGAYTLYFVQSSGGGFWLGIALAPIVGTIVGIIIERLVIRYLYDFTLKAFLVTMGLSLVLQSVIQLLFGVSPQRVDPPNLLKGPVILLDVIYPTYRLFMIAVSFVIILAVIIVYRRTSFGLNLRAVIQNKEMAKALGVDAERTYQIAFGAGAGLAAVAGALVAPMTVVTAHMGLRYLGPAFFVVIVGGTGTIAGVLVGSIFIGGLETLFNEFVNVALSPALVLILAIIVVRFRGGGLIKGYGRSQEDYVKAF